VEKYGRTGQVIGDKMAYVYCMLNTTRICNTYYFSTGTIVSRNASLLLQTHIACLLILGYASQICIIIGCMFPALEPGYARRNGD
jgi:hypothetical protein